MHYYSKRRASNEGFTLIEILLVVAAIAILAGIVIVAVSPGRQLAETRNAQRISNINTILSAVNDYTIQENGVPSTIPESTECPIASGGDSEIAQTDAADTTGFVDLSVLTTNETYLPSIPIDPQVTGTDGTGYHIVKSTNDRVTVCAPSAEQGETIEVTR